MAASTTRLGLYKPGGGSSGLIVPDEAADIDKINGNMDKLDDAAGAYLCTSGTRPATPFSNQIIRETDTKNVMIWSSAAGRWNPVGIPYCTGDANLATLFPTPQPGDTVIRTDLGANVLQGYSSNGGWRLMDSGLIPCSVGSLVNGTSTTRGRVTITPGTLFVDIRGCFPTPLTSFLIKFIDVQSSIGATLTASLIAGTVVDTTANYNFQVQQTNASSVVAAAGAGATQWSVINTAVGRSSGEIRLEQPNTAAVTYGTTDAVGFIGGVANNMVLSKHGISHNLAATYDGIRLAVGGGTFTAGAVEIYGFAH